VGTWESSVDGQWTVTTTEVQNYAVVSSTTGNILSSNPSTMDFTCDQLFSGTQYIIRYKKKVEYCTL